MEGEKELFGRDDPQVGLHTTLESHAGLGVTLGRDLGDSFHGREPIHDRTGIGRGDEKVEVAHRFHPTAQTTGGLDPLDLGQVLQARKNPISDLSRFPPEVTGSIGLSVLDPG